MNKLIIDLIVLFLLALLVTGWNLLIIYTIYLILSNILNIRVVITREQMNTEERHTPYEPIKNYKSYPMFVDDERFPPNNFPKEGVVIRSTEAFINYVSHNGMPTFISFDHDLGGNDTAMNIVNYIIDRDLHLGDIPKGFTFFVHSQNPVGKSNIEKKLNSYLEYRNAK